MNNLQKDTYLTFYPSPIGILKIEFSNSALLSIDFEEQIREIKNNCSDHFYKDKKVLQIYNLIFDQLNQYFIGQRQEFDIPVKLNGTEFEKKVWNYLKKIPYGKTASYKEVAESIELPGAARAVGRANNKNPISIIIPCHRVISADGSLNGYADGVWRKRWLLNHEIGKTNKLERKISFV